MKERTGRGGRGRERGAGRAQGRGEGEVVGNEKRKCNREGKKWKEEEIY